MPETATLNLAALVISAINAEETVFHTTDGQVHDRSQTLGASEAFHCQRQLWLQKNQPDAADGPQSKGHFVRGHTCENVVVDALKSQLPEGIQYLYTGEQQQTLINDRVSATPDGLLVYGPDPADCCVVEIKSLDPRSDFDSPKSRHVLQTQIQMALFHRLTEYQPLKAILVYLDSSDYAHVVQHEVTFDPTVIEVVEQRAAEIFSVSTASALPAEGIYSDECRFCNFTSACGQAVIRDFPTEKASQLSSSLENNLNELIFQRAEKAQAIKLLTLGKGQLDEQIKQLLRANDIRSARTESWSVSYANLAGRKVLDSAAMEQAGLNLAPFYKTSKATERLTIKVKNDGKNESLLA